MSWRIARRGFLGAAHRGQDAAGTAVLTRAQAEGDYGVVLDPETYEKLEVRR
jgi:hypothetical protein